MADKQENGLSHWWAGFRNRVIQSVSQTQGAFALGKVAGVAVTDNSGRTLVEAGQRIDTAILAQAKRAGKVSALALSVMKARTQDFKEKVQEKYGKTQGQRESQLLNSVEEYREARNYRGRMLTMDVTDIHGNIIIPAGKELQEDDIRNVRDANLLGAFLVAAQQSVPAPPDSGAPAPAPFTSTVSVGRSAPVRLGGTEEEDAR